MAGHVDGDAAAVGGHDVEVLVAHRQVGPNCFDKWKVNVVEEVLFRSLSDLIHTLSVLIHYSAAQSEKN